MATRRRGGISPEVRTEMGLTTATRPGRQATDGLYSHPEPSYPDYTTEDVRSTLRELRERPTTRLPTLSLPILPPRWTEDQPEVVERCVNCGHRRFGDVRPNRKKRDLNGHFLGEGRCLVRGGHDKSRSMRPNCDCGRYEPTPRELRT